MKFKNMVEGKKYEHQGAIYTKREGLLFNIPIGKYSAIRMSDVYTMDFTEVIDFVGIEEAFEHLENGGRAKFHHKDCCVEKVEIGIGNNLKSEYGFIALNKDYLQKRWELL